MNKKLIKIGVTGSIGMGKTTIINQINIYKFPTWNSDAIVHILYRKGNYGYSIIKNLVPEAAKSGHINRNTLSKHIIEKPILLEKIQKLIYPLLEKNRLEFIKKHSEEKMIFFDIPLLYETKCDVWLDYVIVATAPYEVQKRRVLSRPSMTEKKFNFILTQQMSDKEKKSKADFIINTDVNKTLLASNIKFLLEKIQNEYC